MKKKYSGSCHCGAVAFECEADLGTGTSKCNCSVCRKGRYWKTRVPEAEFKLLRGVETLTDYQFGSDTIHHMFCSRCGIKTFGRANLDIEFQGEKLQGEFYAVNIACLDDASDEELSGADVRFEDGRNNDWEHAPGETGYL